VEWILKVGLGREVQSIYLDGHLNPRPEQVKVCMAMTALKQCVNKYQEGNAKKQHSWKNDQPIIPAVLNL